MMVGPLEAGRERTTVVTKPNNQDIGPLENGGGILTGALAATLAKAVVHEIATRLETSPRRAEFFRAIAHAAGLLFHGSSVPAAGAAPARPVTALPKPSPAPRRKPKKVPCCTRCGKPGHRRQSCPRVQSAPRESRPRPAANGSAKGADADPDPAPTPAEQAAPPNEEFVADFLGRLRAMRLDQARRRACRKKPGPRRGRKMFPISFSRKWQVFEALDRAVDGMLSKTLEVLDDGSPILRELSAAADRHGRHRFKNWRESLDFVSSPSSHRWRDVDPLKLRLVSDAMKAAAAEDLERRGMAFVDLRLPQETEALLERERETEAFFEEQAMRAVG